jgi:hypothetical protein
MKIGREAVSAGERNKSLLCDANPMVCHTGQGAER